MPASSTSPAIGVDSSSTLPGRWLRSATAAEPHAADPLGPAQHDRGRTLVRRAQHPEVERLADDPGCEHLLGVTAARNIAFGLCSPHARFLTTSAARSSLVSPWSAIVRCARSAK